MIFQYNTYFYHELLLVKCLSSSAFCVAISPLRHTLFSVLLYWSLSFCFPSLGFSIFLSNKKKIRSSSDYLYFLCLSSCCLFLISPWLTFRNNVPSPIFQTETSSRPFLPCTQSIWVWMCSSIFLIWFILPIFSASIF